VAISAPTSVEHRTLTPPFSVPIAGTRRVPWRFLFDWKIRGEDHGTRNFALAAGRADTGDHSVVAVLRPLTRAALDTATLDQALPLAGPVFLLGLAVEIGKPRAFSSVFRYDP
jgi:hypothetical protein